jgi:serine/alanine racemase
MVSLLPFGDSNLPYKSPWSKPHINQNINATDWQTGVHMKVHYKYSSIDIFRLVAAILIVAIHTSPLTSINVTADFIVTRIIARVAVPFFFMTTGYFLYREPEKQKLRQQQFLSKTAILYGVAILLYLPLNLYMGYFRSEQLLIQILKDLLFNGTLYHLWYLPAALLGVLITSLIIQQCRSKAILIIPFLLYLIGLFGDSYYGIAIKSDILSTLYNNIFILSDYARNGLFYAPIFLVMGAYIAGLRKRPSLPVSITLFVISFSVMCIEGLLLNYYNLQKHDSMYLFLLPLMYYLYHILLYFNSNRTPILRNMSITVYLVHPMVILLIRVVAKGLRLEQLLITNSVIHFMFVTVGSLLIATLVVVLQRKLKQKNQRYHQKLTSRAWLEINIANLKNNARALKDIMPANCDMMAIVKANAYGHGVEKVSKSLNQSGISTFGVATIDEGITLRKQGIRGEILVMGYSDISRVPELIHYRLSQTVIDYDYGLKLNAAAAKKQLKVHLKIDTGMHRIGIDVREYNMICHLFQQPQLNIQGIFTHLSVCDSTDEKDILFTEGQINSFYELIHQLEQKNITPPKIHIQSSYGLLNYPQLRCDYARIGIALYGTLSSLGDQTKEQPLLLPVLSLKARVALIREIEAGESVSYGRTFTTHRYTRLAVLPIGYADGLPRTLSCETGKVLLHGQQVPIVGRICMDQLLIDITDVPEVRPGDIATIIGQDGVDEITATEVASLSGSITNELLSRLGSRLERVYLYE